MLTEASYHTAIYVYIGTALLALLLMVWWLRRSWGRGWRLLLFLCGAALLLTPAYPQEGVDTLAPALVVWADKAGLWSSWAGVPVGDAEQ